MLPRSTQGLYEILGLTSGFLLFVGSVFAHGLAGLLIMVLGLSVFFPALHFGIVHWFGKNFRFASLFLFISLLGLVVLFEKDSSPDVELVIVKENERSNEDFITTMELRIQSETDLRNLYIEVRGKHISVLDVAPRKLGLSYMVGEGQTTDTLAYANFPEPSSGTYFIEVKSKASDNITISHRVTPLIDQTTPVSVLSTWLKNLFSIQLPLYIFMLPITVVSLFLYAFRAIVFKNRIQETIPTSNAQLAANEVLKAQRLEALKNLSTKEKQHLQEFVVHQTKTFLFGIFDPIARGLASEGVLRILGDYPNHQAIYKIEEWAWVILKENPHYLKS